jgi:peptidoglycan/xylan/chitin deacetylase (PgdA/CDA1 family)
MAFRIVNSAKTLGATLVSATNVHRLHSSFCRNQITILLYHGVVRAHLPVTDWCFLDDSLFRRQIAYLIENFSIVSLSAAINLLKNGAVDKPTVVLTFDDGYQNNFDVAFPVLKQYGIPATIFLTTGLVDSSDTVWFCHIIRALSCTLKQSIRWNDTDLDLSKPRLRAAASIRLQASLKEYPPAELGSLVQRIYEVLDVDPLTPLDLDSPFRMLTGSSIRTMLESGLVEFGAHTQTHAILSLLSPEDQWREISCSVTAVEHVTGQPCRLFAYPNGRTRDYDAKTIGLLRKCGVFAAVSTVSGSNDSRTSLMELKRYGVGSNVGMPMFQLLVHHFIDHFRNRN